MRGCSWYRQPYFATGGQPQWINPAVFISGDSRSANDPLLLLSRPAPTRQRLFKGKQHLLQEKRAFVSDLNNLCTQQAATRTSPIFSGIQSVAAHLRSIDSQDGDRQMFVISDLRENVEPRIKKALDHPAGTKSKLPSPINNTRLTVILCGYAQTRDRQTLQSERLVEVWSQLFTDPQRVKFEPFCPANPE